MIVSLRPLLVAALLLAGLAAPATFAIAADDPTAVAALDRLAADYWEGLMEASPTWATQLGDRRFDARLSDNSPQGDARDHAWLENMLGRAKAIDPADLDAERRVTRGLLIEEVEGGLAQETCRFHEWVVDPLNGPQVSLIDIGETT